MIDPLNLIYGIIGLVMGVVITLAVEWWTTWSMLRTITEVKKIVPDSEEQHEDQESQKE